MIYPRSDYTSQSLLISPKLTAAHRCKLALFFFGGISYLHAPVNGASFLWKCVQPLLNLCCWAYVAQTPPLSTEPPRPGPHFFGSVFSHFQTFVIGPTRPRPRPFSFYSERKGGKEAPQGAKAPLNPPVGLLTQKAARLQTVPLTKSGCPHSKSVFLFPWAADKLHGHGKWNAFFREANAAQRRGRHSRWCIPVVCRL